MSTVAIDETNFGALEWALFAVVVTLWGSSFFLIAIGIEHLHPTVVAAGRIGGGAVALALFKKARRPLPREAWTLTIVLGLVWMAVPFMLFTFAQQWIDSSMAGMLNASAPLFTALIAAIIARRLPSRRSRLGLLVGFAGVVLMTSPAFGSARATALGIAMIVVAAGCYGVAFNLSVPLQRRYGTLPVLLRAELAALLAVTPFALAGLNNSTFAWSSVIAVAILGALGTGIAFVAFVNLAGRVGATRASLNTYLMPVMAVLLGVLFLGETLTPIVMTGAALTIAGAYLATRANTSRVPKP